MLKQGYVELQSLFTKDSDLEKVEEKGGGVKSDK